MDVKEVGRLMFSRAEQPVNTKFSIWKAVLFLGRVTCVYCVQYAKA